MSKKKKKNILLITIFLIIVEIVLIVLLFNVFDYKKEVRMFSIDANDTITEYNVSNSNSYNTCGVDLFNKLKDEANKINLKYDFEKQCVGENIEDYTGEFSDEYEEYELRDSSGDEDIPIIITDNPLEFDREYKEISDKCIIFDDFFIVNINNVSEELYLKVTNKNNLIDKEFKSINNNSIIIRPLADFGMYTYEVDVYSRNEPCKDILLRKFTFITPLYNPYTENEYCQMEQNYQVGECTEYIFDSNVDLIEISKKIDENSSKLNYKKESKKNKIILIVILVIIVLITFIIFFIVIKKKSGGKFEL